MGEMQNIVKDMDMQIVHRRLEARKRYVIFIEFYCYIKPLNKSFFFENATILSFALKIVLKQSTPDYKYLLIC